MYTLTAEKVVEMGTATKSNEPPPSAIAPGERLVVPGALPTLDTSPGKTATEPQAMLTSLPEFLDGWLDAHEGEIIAARRHIHAHPRLSRQEHDTADFVAARLIEAGLQPQIIPDGTGLTCDIGTGDRVIAIRADMDALPIHDPKQVPYRSTVDGVCHACGHDAHTAIVLGVARVLAELERGEGLPGRFRLVFQPSEEQFPSGAPTMIKYGALTDVAAIFAFHCDPQFPAGQVAVRNGPLTAACDVFEIRMRGRGGHTSRPHLTSDLVNAIGRVVVDVPALVNRRLDPRQSVAIVFGAVQAGEAANAIPQQALARATVRVHGRETWDMIPDLVQEVTRSVARASGVECEIDYRRGVPPVVNDRAASAMFAGATAAALGDEAVAEAPMSMGGEDFAYYLEQIPGAMARLGVGRPGERLDIHQGDFDIDEAALAHGVRVMTHTVLAAAQSPAF
jgi:amidohydrolase